MFLLYSLRLGAPIWPIGVGGPRVLPVRAHSSYATDSRPIERGSLARLISLKRTTNLSFYGLPMERFIYVKAMTREYILLRRMNSFRSLKNLFLTDNFLFLVCPISIDRFILFKVLINILEVTIARKVLPHPQGIKGSMHNLQHELHL